MSFSTDITLTDDSAGTSNLGTISVQDSKHIWRMPPLATPEIFTVSHNTNGKGESLSDRHLVRMDKTKEDAEVDGIATLSASVYLVIDKPRRVFTDAEVTLMIEKLVNFAVANTQKLLDGEV